MNVGDAVLDAIVRQPMFWMECPDAPNSGCMAVWNANAAEQIEAVIAACGYVRAEPEEGME